MRRALRIAEGCYSALLGLYPRPFRAAYGPQMRLTFRDASRAAHRRHGPGGLVALWLSTLLDLFKSAFEEQVRQGEFGMSPYRLRPWAGPLNIMVGALWLLAALGVLGFQVGLLAQEAQLGLIYLPFFLAFLPLLFALLGTRLRFNAAAGPVGRLGLALGVAGSAGVILAVLISFVLGGTAPQVAPGLWINDVALISFHGIRAGYLLFGLEALRTGPLPRWNWLPLVLGLTGVLALPLQWFGAPAWLPVYLGNQVLHFGLAGLCWVLLGLALLEPRRTPQTAAL